MTNRRNNRSQSEESTLDQRADDRPGRIPLSERDILTVQNKQPGFVYRWVTDDRVDKLMRYKNAGWEFCNDQNLQVGDVQVSKVEQAGGLRSQITGVHKNGDPQISYLMSIREDWYNEDQQRKIEKRHELHKAIHNQTLEGGYGEIREVKEN